MASTLTKNINSNYTPTFMSGYPIYAYGGIPHQYGFGSWLKKNAGTVGMLAGAGIGTAIAPGIGTQIGAQIGGQVGGSVQGAYQQNQQQEQQQNALLEQQKRDLVSNLPAQHNYTPTFADGGSIHIKPSKRGTFTAQATKMGMGIQEAASKILNAPEGRYSPAMRKKANFAKNFAKADGGELEPIPSISPILNSYTPQLVDTRNRIYSKDNTFNGKTTYFDEAQRLDAEMKMLEALQNPTFKQQATMDQIPLMKEDLYVDQVSKKAMGGNLDMLVQKNGGQINDRLNEIKSGSTHEQSPFNGVPVTNDALLEDKEFLYTTKDGKKYVFSNRF